MNTGIVARINVKHRMFGNQSLHGTLVLIANFRSSQSGTDFHFCYPTLNSDSDDSKFRKFVYKSNIFYSAIFFFTFLN